MAKCFLCKEEKPFLSKVLKICLDCIRAPTPKSLVWGFIEKAHQEVREKYNLPAFPPKTKDGIKCNICQNKCQMGDGQKGYCGLRENKKGKPSTRAKPRTRAELGSGQSRRELRSPSGLGAGLVPHRNEVSGAGLESKVSPNLGLLYSYFDPIPTNCCASWFCPASREAVGKNNLSIFFYGCGFNCLFCQNYSHKLIEEAPRVKIDELLKKALDPSVYCLCFFGGSPESQLPFVINFSRKISKIKKIKICLEWNGIGNKNLVKKVTELVLKSKGIIKFDLKTFNENLSYALSGVSNKKTYENFKMIAKEFLPKADYQMLTATTLLVPGYLDKIEVEKISKFIASLNPEIPYSLLVFYPAFYMTDLPITPRDWAFECLETAKKYLKNINLGNIHLLGL